MTSAGRLSTTQYRHQAACAVGRPAERLRTPGNPFPPIPEDSSLQEEEPRLTARTLFSRLFPPLPSSSCGCTRTCMGRDLRPTWSTFAITDSTFCACKAAGGQRGAKGLRALRGLERPSSPGQPAAGSEGAAHPAGCRPVLCVPCRPCRVAMHSAPHGTRPCARRREGRGARDWRPSAAGHHPSLERPGPARQVPCTLHKTDPRSTPPRASPPPASLHVSPQHGTTPCSPPAALTEVLEAQPLQVKDHDACEHRLLQQRRHGGQNLPLKPLPGPDVVPARRKGRGVQGMGRGARGCRWGRGHGRGPIGARRWAGAHCLKALKSTWGSRGAAHLPFWV